MGAICDYHEKDNFSRDTVELISGIIESKNKIHDSNIFGMSLDLNSCEVNPFYKSQIPDYNSKTCFQDPLFRPDITSIINEKTISKEILELITEDEMKIFKSLIWLHPRDIFKGIKYKIYNEIEISDIMQGHLKNSYFLSAVSSFAKFPERFENVFINKDLVVNGCYSIKFYINGKPKIVTIDHYFPCDSQKRKWAFSQSGYGEIWVQLLEKAWSKICGSYTDSLNGHPSEALSCLSEAPCIKYLFSDYDSEGIWKILSNSENHNFTLCAFSREGKEVDEVGISPSLTYTVISCIQYENKRFIKLRNPWGFHEWNGDYSDNSKLWTKELKKALNLEISDDGVFFMTFNDFMKYFNQIVACEYLKNHVYSFKKFKPFPSNSFVIEKFEIKEDINNVTITLHQKNPKFFKKNSDYECQYSRLILAKLCTKTGKLNYVDSKFSNDEKIHLTFNNLVKGIYFIIANINWDYKEKCSFVISTYSPITINLQDISFDELKLDWLLDIFESSVKSDSKILSLQNVSININNETEMNKIGYKIIILENKSSRNLKVTFNLIGNTNLIYGSQLISKDRDFLVDLLIPSGKKNICFFELLNANELKIETINFTSNESINTYSELENATLSLIYNINEYLDREILCKNVFFTFLKNRNQALFIFVNNSEYQVNIKVKFTKYINLNIINDESILSVQSQSLNYMSFLVTDINQPIDYQMNYSFNI